MRHTISRGEGCGCLGIGLDWSFGPYIVNRFSPEILVANLFHFRLLPLAVKVNDHELQTVGYFLWISSKVSSMVRTPHCSPTRPRSPLSLPARLFASGRTAEPDAPLRFTFVTTRAERSPASFYYPPQRTPILVKRL
jgi:hypothetical protein